MRGQCILAVECDWRIRKLIRANLEAVGLLVREAVSGPHGLQVASDNRPDLILIDLDMPDTDALTLLRAFQLRFRDRPVPIVVMCAEPPGRYLLDHEPVVGCIQKPFSASVLLQQIQQALNSRSSFE
jgi:CheY-like chemotaxis protein